VPWTQARQVVPSLDVYSKALPATYMKATDVARQCWRL